MKNYYKIFSFYLLIFGLQSCQDVIEIDLPDTAKRIVIDGRVTDATPTYVFVTTTTGYFEQGSTPRVSNAAVVLYEDGDTVAILVPDSIPGLYSTPFQGTIGKNYEVSVEVFPGNASFDASLWRSTSEELTRTAAIDSINIRRLSRNTTPQVFREGFYALMYFQEPDGVGDNYRLRRWKNDSIFSQEIITFDDEFIDGLYVGSSEPFSIPAFEFYGPFDPAKNDSVTVELTSISEDHLSFLDVLNQQVFQVGGTFDPPPETIIGNIYNANDTKEIGLGYFSASAISTKGLRFSN